MWQTQQHPLLYKVDEHQHMSPHQPASCNPSSPVNIESYLDLSPFYHQEIFGSKSKLLYFLLHYYTLLLLSEFSGSLYKSAILFKMIDAR